MPMLRKLDLNTNKIAKLVDLPDLPSLEHLDLGMNVIETPNGGIPNLGIYTKLKTLIMAGNPFADALGEKLKIEVLLTLRKIKFVGEEEINDEDRLAMKEEAKERKKAEIAAAIEKERIAAERAAAGLPEEEPPAEGAEGAEGEPVEGE